MRQAGGLSYNFLMPDVAIIGGGIIGLTSAYFLAKAGLTVAVYDRGDFGKEASWAGAGILPPGNPDRAATPADKLRGIGSQRFPEFSAELRDLTGIDNGYRRCGGVEFLTVAETPEILALWRAEGIRYWRLDGFRVHPHWRDLGLPFELPDCAQVRNPWHLRALVAVGERAGVRVHANTGAEAWEFDHDRVIALRLADGERVTAGHFLLAAGAWSESLLSALGHRPHVHPVRGQIVLLDTGKPDSATVLMQGKRYLVVRGDGHILVGSTEEPEAGFEKANTEEAVAALIAFAAQINPELAHAKVEKCWCGLRPGTPDGLPFIGRVPGWDNVFVAAGHFRAGVQLSIGTAQAITELVTGKPTCVPLEAFALDRKPSATKSAFRS